MGDFAPEDGPLVQQIALSGACGGRVSANCKPQLAPSGTGVGGWVLVAYQRRLWPRLITDSDLAACRSKYAPNH